MSNRKHPGLEPTLSGAVDEEVWLVGQPSLWEYLEFVKDSVVDGADADRGMLTAEWRAANEYYQELEDTESGIADTAECLHLDPSLAPLAEEVVRDSKRRKNFNTMPVSFGMVELDKLILYQKAVTWTFVERLKEQLGPEPDLEQLFRFCSPLDAPNVEVDARPLGSSRYVFRAPSTDFRFHGPALLRPDQLTDYVSFGPIAGVVALVVGFGSNLLNVIRSGPRLMLHNGYHRACALRSLGITHAPCMIQTVETQDELEITAKSKVATNPQFYFKSARPPLLKDFFDPKIRKAFPVHRQVRIIEVSFEVKDYRVPA